MSIHTLKQRMHNVPGVETLIMNYEPGTGFELFTIKNKTVRVKAGASEEDVEKAFAAEGVK